jgi:Skp family chaperone for outer membrane proteins
MKRTIIIITFLFFGLSLVAQKGDTTKIKLGDTKIIIIDNEKNTKSKEEKREQALKEFQKLLDEKQLALKDQEAILDSLEKKMDNQQKKLESQQDEQSKKEEEQKIKEINDQVVEMNKKVEELNKEVSALEKGVEGLNKGTDDDFDVEIGKDKDWSNKKFDWDFKNNKQGNWDHLFPFGNKDKFNGHWAGFEFGLNNYVNNDRQFTLSEADRGFELNGGHSWTFALNFMQVNMPFGKFAGLYTGLGTSWNNYSFSDNVNLGKNQSGVMVATPDSIISYNKNSLHTWNFTCPLILEFQIPAKDNNSGIYLGVGVYGTAKVASWIKQKYQIDGVEYKEKQSSDFQINNLRYGLTARLGLKYIRLFANYDLVSLFKKDHGPELYPVSIGLTMLCF